MSTIRSGKIARLPNAIREQLNQRLANHESSTPLLKWLNALPEVQAVLAQEFGGKIIVRQNLHEWRHGGYAEWRRLEEARGIVEWLHANGTGAEMAASLNGESISDVMTTWLATRYLVGIKQSKGRGDKQAAAWDQLRECSHDLLAMRRGEYLSQRLELDREKAIMVLRRSALNFVVSSRQTLQPAATQGAMSPPI